MKKLLTDTELVGKTITDFDWDCGLLALHVGDNEAFVVQASSEVDDDVDLSIITDVDDVEYPFNLDLVDLEECEAHKKRQRQKKLDAIKARMNGAMRDLFTSDPEMLALYDELVKRREANPLHPS